MLNFEISLFGRVMRVNPVDIKWIVVDAFTVREPSSTGCVTTFYLQNQFIMELFVYKKPCRDAK